MERKLLIATRNKGKLTEYEMIFQDFPIALVSLFSYPHIPEPEESGRTFEQNAIIKARHGARHSGLVCLADDSGLEVDWLGGLPGVESARFAGWPKSDRRNNEKLLSLLAGVPWEQRTARFRCVIAICVPPEKEFLAEGVLEGFIALDPRGDNGFGYDPLFVVKGMGRTLAELDTGLKNRLSHRGKAAEKAKTVLKSIFGLEGAPLADRGSF